MNTKAQVQVGDVYYAAEMHATGTCWIPIGPHRVVEVDEERPRVRLDTFCKGWMQVKHLCPDHDAAVKLAAHLNVTRPVKAKYGLAAAGAN